MGEHVMAAVPRVPVAVQRVIRQLIQTYGPVILVVLTAPGRTNDLGAVFLALATVVAFTTIKLLLRVKTGPRSAWWLVVLDRAGSAGAAVIVGTGVSDLAGLLTIDWAEVGGAVALAAFLALVMLFYIPPVEPDPTPPADHVPARDDVAEVDELSGFPLAAREPTALPRRPLTRPVNDDDWPAPH